MKKTMILTSMALMSLVAVGCANEEVKDTQDNQPSLFQQIWKKSNIKQCKYEKTINSLFFLW